MPDFAARIPSSLIENTRWVRLGEDEQIPTMLIHPDWQESDDGAMSPIMLWMHGRTVDKELDPGRYLRWMRAGIATCAIDLPGHGERIDAALQQPDRTFDVVMQMLSEIDEIVATLRERYVSFNSSQIGIGGMSAGGMTTLARLTQQHEFTCAAVEGTTGSWSHQFKRDMFKHRDINEVHALNPIEHLGRWQEIPLQAIHTKADEWVKYTGQLEFIEALRKRYANPELIEFVTYESTGAPYEHAGFGKKATDAKTRQTKFLAEAFGLTS